MKPITKPTHGGRRPNAGRKPHPTGKPPVTKPMLISPRVETAAKLRAIAKSERKTPGQIIDTLVQPLPNPPS